MTQDLDQDRPRAGSGPTAVSAAVTEAFEEARRTRGARTHTVFYCLDGPVCMDFWVGRLVGFDG